MNVATAPLCGPRRSNGLYKFSSGRRLFLCVAALLLNALLLFLPVTARAQANSIIQRLPANVWAYASWAGTSSLKSLSDTNPVLRLWHDPSFSAFLTNSIATVSHANGPTKPALTPDERAQLLSALENPAAVGFINDSADSGLDGHPAVRFFLVYDATGKRDIVAALRRERDANRKEPVQRSTITIAGVPVQKSVSASGSYFEAQDGPYVIFTDSEQTMRDLLPRFSAARPSGPSVSESANLPSECRENSALSLLKFAVLPANLPDASPATGFDFHAFSNSLHLNKIRAACGSVDFDKQTARVHGGIWGDTSPGSILNVAGDSRRSFATLPLASANSSFRVSVIDFAALYQSLFSAISAALPPDKAAVVAGITAFLSSSWGMPPDQFLALFTGEVATIDANTSVDPSASFYAFTIRDSAKVLHVLANAFPGEQAKSHLEGDVTYLTVTSNFAAGASPSLLYFAVTPQMLFFSKQDTLVRTAVAAQANNPAKAGSLQTDPAFQKARALLPLMLNSLSYTNYENFNWSKLILDLEKNLNDQAQEAARRANKPAPAPIYLFQGVNPSSLPRYLHFSVSGGWKDSAGLHFDSYTQ